jgi:hypothetical protein
LYNFVKGVIFSYKAIHLEKNIKVKVMWSMTCRFPLLLNELRKIYEWEHQIEIQESESSVMCNSIKNIEWVSQQAL